MSLYGRRRCIVSGSDVPTVTHMLSAKLFLSASYHSTSSCGIGGKVYYDYDCQDIAHLPSINKWMSISASYHDDDSFSVTPNYPPRTSGSSPF